MRHIKLFKPSVTWAAVFNVARVLRSGQLAEGPEVKKFEAELGSRFGLSDVVSLNSGTAALELAYELAGIGAGDEVVTPVLTAPMTNIPLVRRGARIQFVDALDDLNMDIEDAKQKITDKTKAVVFVHYNGNNRGIDEIAAVCKERGIPLIEDAAQALGTDNWGKGDFICLSFQAIKTFTTGDGGALVCKDPELSAKARRLRWFGFDRANRRTADITEAGYKYHMNDITAAIGRGNLRAFASAVKRRATLVEAYRRHGLSAYLWRAFALSDRREELQAALAAAGIDSAVFDNRNDAYSLFGGKRSLRNMDRLEHQYLLLPLHTGMRVSDVERIAAITKPFLIPHS